MQGSLVFAAGPDITSERDRVLARDGRSAVWMAAGWAALTGSAATVVCETDWDHEQAVAAAGRCRAPVRCLGPRGVATSPPASRTPGSRPASRPLRLDRLVAETIRALPPAAVVCVEDADLAALLRMQTADGMLVLDDIAGGARGATLAVAAGAKAAAPERTVAALVRAPAFCAGIADLECAGRQGLAVAAIVASEPLEPHYDPVAAIAGGHGETVGDPSRLFLHLRNAFAASIPTVINAVVPPR